MRKSLGIRFIRRLLFRFYVIDIFPESPLKRAFWPIKADLKNALKALGRITQYEKKIPAEIGIYNTHNQRQALLRDAPNIPVYNFWVLLPASFKLIYIFVLLPAITLSVIRAAASRHNPRKFPFIYLITIFQLRKNIYEVTCKRLEGKTVHFSSDHQGPIFELFNRECTKIEKIFHAHGVILERWPSNDYEQYIKKEQEPSPFDSNEVRQTDNSKTPKYEAVIFFNSVQSLKYRLKTIKILRSLHDSLAIKYHPRRSPTFIEKLYCRRKNIDIVVKHCRGDVLLLGSLNYCANSSILQESYTKRPKHTVWIRSLPPHRDFYGLDELVSRLDF